jgi:hypothetical protein
MPAPRRRYRKTTIDHLADALEQIEAAEAALGRIADATLNAAAKDAIQRLREAVTAGKVACADGIEALLVKAPEPPT